MRALIAVLLCAATMSCAQDYTLTADSQEQPGVPHGKVSERMVLPAGKFYPGTPHNYQIYVPAQYDPAKPTAFMIFLDGGGYVRGQHIPAVFDNLIAKGDMPPTIGIFIDPGVQPALSDAAMGRRERIFEYDNISPRFAEFLEAELIPAVAKSYNLSKNPDDRGIGGTSTGAVGAFVAAWNRPDLFHRVLTLIGTFVDMKGADTLPAMIRRTEPKPLRVWLQDGKNDHIVPGQPYGTFYGGSWPINNQVMYEAFQFAGYDVKLSIGTGGHDTVQGAAEMPAAMRWLWRDYPKPVLAGAPPAMNEKGWDPRGQVYGVLLPGKGWEKVGGAYQSVSSPTADRDGNVFFADAAANRIYRSDADGKVSVFKENSGGATVIRFGPDGRLYASQPGRGRIVSWGPSGDEKVVAQNVVAADLAITAKSDVYYTNGSGVERTGGKKLALNFRPSALVLSPDQALLDVADPATKFSWSYQLGADGGPINGEPFFRIDTPELAAGSGVGGAAMDSIGQVYWATSLGIQFCEQNGRCAAILGPPERGAAFAGIAFGGKDMNWLYAAQGNQLYRRETKSRGVTAWSPVKPPNPPL